MAAVSRATREYIPDTDGTPLVGAHVRFFDAGTTTPRAVFSDAALSSAIATSDLKTDARGYLPLIFMSAGAYKRITYDADPGAGGVIIRTDDAQDPGVATTGGDLAVADGGTGASTAAGARTNLGAASQTALDAASASVTAIEAQITAVGGTLNDLAGLDTVARAQLAAGFGVLPIKRSEVAASTATATCAGTIPKDNTVPQISEGTEVLTGSYTPVSASSVLDIEVYLMIANDGSDRGVCAALFQNTDLSAIQAMWTTPADGGDPALLMVRHHMNSPGTSPVTFSVRVGGESGTSYLNGTAASRMGGGAVRSYIRITEYLTV